MPRSVSLSDNIRIARRIGAQKLPLARNVSIFSRMFLGASMDYQRLHMTDDGKINRNYVSFGNYNYGAVMAAAGYSLDEAMEKAGRFNYWRSIYEQLLGRKLDTTGAYNLNRNGEMFIPMGYNDYMEDRIPLK